MCGFGVGNRSVGKISDRKFIDAVLYDWTNGAQSRKDESSDASRSYVRSNEESEASASKLTLQLLANSIPGPNPSVGLVERTNFLERSREDKNEKAVMGNLTPPHVAKQNVVKKY